MYDQNYNSSMYNPSMYNPMRPVIINQQGDYAGKFFYETSHFIKHVIVLSKYLKFRQQVSHLPAFV